MHPRMRVSTSASTSGSRYSWATPSSSSPPVTPASTNSTNRGHTRVVRATCGAAAKASSYAIDSATARVQITPIRPLWVAATARRVAGRITSTTGTSYRSRASRSIAALAELQAITSALTPSATRWSRHSRAYSLTSPMGLGPYGWRAVSPR